MKTKTFKNNIKAYMVLAVGVLVMNSHANAQIIYTDVNPDVYVPVNVNYYIDLNKNGTNNFHFWQGWSMAEVFTNSSDDEVLCDASGAFPLSLSNGQSIDASKTIWNSTGNVLNNYGAGEWVGVQDEYLGVRIKISGQWHYGWIRLDVPADSGIVVKDYAYESTPNQGILAGNKGSAGIQESNLLKNVSVYSYNKTLYVDLKDNHINDGMIKLYNLMGQEVKSVAIDNTKMEINTNDILKGIYFIKAYVDDKLFVKKLIVQ